MCQGTATPEYLSLHAFSPASCVHTLSCTAEWLTTRQESPCWYLSCHCTCMPFAAVFVLSLFTVALMHSITTTKGVSVIINSASTFLAAQSTNTSPLWTGISRIPQLCIHFLSSTVLACDFENVSSVHQHSSLLILQGRLLTSELADARQLGQHVQATLLPHVEQLLLVDFPLRSGSAVDSLDLSMGFKLDEVSVSLKVAQCEWHAQ